MAQSKQNPMKENNQIEKLAEEWYETAKYLSSMRADIPSFIAGYTAANKGVGMKWVKASERLPDTKGHYITKRLSVGFGEWLLSHARKILGVGWTGNAYDDNKTVEEYFKDYKLSPEYKALNIGEKEKDQVWHNQSDPNELRMRPSQPLPDGGKIDWDAIRKIYEYAVNEGRLFIFSPVNKERYADEMESSWKEFRARPEFQQGGKEEIVKLINEHWRFDSEGRPLSNLLAKQALIDKLNPAGGGK